MNAGLGGFREGAWYGLPFLCVPTTFETDSNARQVEKLQAGVVVPLNASAAVLREGALRLLAEPHFRENSARIGAECRASGGAEHAADLVLNYVRQTGVRASEGG